MTSCPTLETERLIMRPFCDDDLNSYAAMMDTSQLRESLRIPDEKGRPEAWFEMAWWRGQWELRGTGNWALEDKESGTFIGRAGLHNPEREDWPGVEWYRSYLQCDLHQEAEMFSCTEFITFYSPSVSYKDRIYLLG